MSSDTYSYTVRIVAVSPTATLDERFCVEEADMDFMRRHGWTDCAHVFEDSHTAITYRRPAGITSVCLTGLDGEILRTNLD